MSKIGFAVIGAGLWGEIHARVFSAIEGACLVGIYDSLPDRARLLADSLGTASYSNFEDLLADERVHAVSIATPDFAHSEVALCAIRAGKHVLVEKPMATKNKECEEMLQAAEDQGVKLMVDFHTRWSPPFVKAWQSIRNGDIGEPQHMYLRLNDRIEVPTKMLSWSSRSTVGWFIGTHSVDTVRWLIGDEVQRVFAVSRSRVLRSMGIDTPDFFQMVLEFKNGATAVVENSWILPNSTPNIVDLKCEIIGSKGSVYIDGSHHRMVEKYTEAEGSFPDVTVMPKIYGKQMGYAAESIRDFADCVIHDRQLKATGRDGLEVTKVLVAMEESVKTGLPVDIG
jgi:predicted dehydrogenase